MKKILLATVFIILTAVFSSILSAEDSTTNVSDANSASIIDQFAEMQKSLVSNAFTNDPFFKNNTEESKQSLNLGLTGGYPQMKYKKNPDNYTITFVTPGIKKKDLNITLKNNTLTVSGAPPTKSSSNTQSMSYDDDIAKKFSRTIPLPADSKLADISSKYDNGILTIIVPRDNKVDTENIMPITIE